MDMKLSKLYDIVEDGEPGVLQSMGLQRARHDLANEQQQNTKTWARNLEATLMPRLVNLFIGMEPQFIRIMKTTCENFCKPFMGYGIYL